MDWDTTLELIFEFAKSISIKLLVSGIYTVIGLRIIKRIKKWIKTSSKFSKTDDGARSFLAALASAFAAIGLAMQGALSNFASGVMILHPKRGWLNMATVQCCTA